MNAVPPPRGPLTRLLTVSPMVTPTGRASTHSSMLRRSLAACALAGGRCVSRDVGVGCARPVSASRSARARTVGGRAFHYARAAEAALNAFVVAGTVTAPS